MAFEKVTVTVMLDPAPPPVSPIDAVSTLDTVRRAIPDDARIGYWVAPDGWRLRRFDWPARNPRGRLLFQAGRGDIFEKYLETIAHFHAQGWSITSFDWRGQGGSGRLSADPYIGHVPHFADYDSDLAAFWREWRGEAAGPTAILGHSMGGLMVMRALADAAIDPDAAILVAPMLGLKSPFGPTLSGRIARYIASRAPVRAAWRQNERPAAFASRQKLLTNDTARYLDERWWHERDPALRLGPPSWTWLSEAFAGTAQLAGDARVEGIAVPVLMLVADADRLVDPRAALRVADRLRDVRVLRFGPESAHEILREADPVRNRALAEMDAFLDSAAAT